MLDECVGRALHRVVALEGPARLPRRLEVARALRRRRPGAAARSAASPTVDPEVVGAVAAHLLEQTAYEWDGRGVTMVGVTLPLPGAASA